jgi:ribosome-binding factor A
MTRGEAKAPDQRLLRVGEELRHALAAIFERGEVRDPGLAAISVTVSEVRVTPDLRNAVVFVAPFGGGEPDAMLMALTRARPFLRRRLASLVRLKYTPDLSFRLDQSFDQANRIDALLRGAEPGGGASSPAGDPDEEA